LSDPAPQPFAAVIATSPPVSGATAHDTSQAYSPRRRTMAFMVVAVAFVMDLLDTTIMHVALPAIRDGLGAGAAALQWSVAGYALAFAMTVVTGGRLGDVFGYRRMFLVGVGSFTAASLLCGMAISPWQLVLARALQGASGALMVPQVMALMQVMYKPEERLRVFSIFGVLGGAASALGPVAGGLLIEADILGLGWRSAFLINGPVGLLAMVAGLRLLPAGAGAHPKALDLVGTALAAAALLALLLPLIEGPEQGWPVWCAFSLLAALLLAALTWRAWLRRQAHDASALVNPVLLGLATVRRGLLAGLALRGVVPAYLLGMTFVVQGGLGATPHQMALLCLPIAIGAALSITLLSRLVLPRLGHRSILLGAALQGLALALAGGVAHHLLSAAPQGGGAALNTWLFVAHGLLGLGIGLIGPALATATLEDVPLAEAGSASGLVGMVQQLAAALAMALVGGLMFMGHIQAQDPVALQNGLMRTIPALLLLLFLGACAWRR
jgi:MFS family permease